MPSKLGPHFIGTPGFERWLAAGVRVMKFDPGSLGASLQVPPGILVVGKLDQRDDNLKLTDWKALMKQGKTAAKVARLRFEAQRNIYVGKNKPSVDRYAVNPRIDVWEDDNEVVPDNAAEANWYTEYCIAMMQHYESIGKKRANFSFATGTPDVRPGHADDIWSLLLPAIRHAHANGHYIAMHEYMGPYADLGVGHRQVDIHRQPKENAWHGRLDSQGNPDESYPYGLCPLRYRWIYDLYLRPAGLADTKLIITECGCDGVDPITPIDMESGSWTSLRDGYWQRVGLDANVHYASMLQWYDQRLREDDFVLGALIFTVGSPGKGRWKDFDITGSGVESRVLDYIGAERNKADQPVAQPGVASVASSATVSQAAAETGLAAVSPPPTASKPDSQPAESGPNIGFVFAPAGLFLRVAPSTEARTLDRLPDGTRLEILSREGEWLSVNVNGQSGYVYGYYVTEDKPKTTEPPVVIATRPQPSANGHRFQPGMNINTEVHGPDIERMRGLSWVRYVLMADSRNRSIDDAFRNTYGPLIEEYAAAGIKSLIILNQETVSGNAPWQTGDWASYNETFGRAARRAAELAAPYGDMVAFQIWNEQDSQWGNDTAHNPSAIAVPPEQYAGMLDIANRQINEAAPKATVVTGGFKTGPGNIRDYLKVVRDRLGGRLPADAVAIHPYGRYTRKDYFNWNFGTLAESIDTVRSAIAGLPIWITEIGVVAGGNYIGPEHYDNYASYMRDIVDEVANNQRDKVPVLIWFSWTDKMVNAGVLTEDGREKAAVYNAFLAMKARAGVQSDTAGKSLEDLLDQQQGYINAPAGLWLRSEPSIEKGDGSKVNLLMQNSPVTILETADGWYRVQAGDQQGFVYAEYVTLLPPGATTVPAPTNGRRHRDVSSIIGVHGAPGGAAPPRHMWDKWTSYLNEMDIRWYKQCETGDGTDDGSIFQWVLHLKRSGIEPIVRFLQSEQFPDNLEQRFIDQARRYAEKDVRWVEIGNEPNLDYEWKTDWRGKIHREGEHKWWYTEEPRMRWGNDEAIETLARVWVEDATRAANAGAWPAFYAFAPTDWRGGRPNGQFSSVKLTDRVVARLASHHRQATIDLFRNRKAWIAVHVAKYDMPLAYDPYSEDPARPWDMALRGYEVVLNAFRRHFGHDLDVDSIPIISTEGGVFVPEHSNKAEGDGRVAPNDEEHARQTVEMFRYVAEHTPLTAMCPWCLCEGEFIGHGTSEFRHHGWFKSDHGQLKDRPIYHAMRRLRDEGSGKGVSLESLAAEGLESLAETSPAAAEKEATITVTLNLQIKIEGGGVKDVVVNVNPEVAD